MNLIAFTEELAKIGGLEKVALLATTPKMKAKEKAERHFSTSDPNWGEFEENLKSKHFQREVSGHPMADDKLKKYVKNYGGYLSSKDVLGEEKSETTPGRKYKIKKVGRRTACGCGDFQYVHSHRGGDCKHVAKFKKESLAQKVKAAFVADLLHAATLADKVNRRSEKQTRIGRQAVGGAKQLQGEEAAYRQQKKMQVGSFA